MLPARVAPSLTAADAVLRAAAAAYWAPHCGGSSTMTLAVAPRDVVAERAAIDARIAGRTLVGTFAETVERLGAAEALKWKEDGVWRALSWQHYREAVAEVALGLVSLGLQPYEFTVLMSRNRPEPMIADLATQHARGVPVFLYNTLAPEQVAYIAGHCEARVAFVEDRHFLAILQTVKDQLPKLDHVVLIDAEPEPGDDGWTMTWEELRAAGRRALAADPGAFDALWRQVRPDDLAAVIYTSGTTGRPKGVMISQSNVLWEAAASEGINPSRPGERIISYLPLAHATGRWVDLWSQVVFGTTVYCCPDPTQVFQYALEVHPTVMVGVPRVWEKLHTALQAGIAGSSSRRSWPSTRRAPPRSARRCGPKSAWTPANGRIPVPRPSIRTSS